MSNVTTLPVYLINLDRRPDRLKVAEAQLSDMSLPFVRQSAVDGLELHSNRKDIPLIPLGQEGAMASHRLVWERIVQGESEFALILEDDVELDPELNWPVLLNSLAEDMSRKGVGLLQLGYISYGWRSRLTWAILDLLKRRELRGQVQHESASQNSVTTSLAGIPIVTDEFRMGTHCYLLSKTMARSLIPLNSPPILHGDILLERLATLNAESLGGRICRVKSSMAGQLGMSGGRSPDSDVSK
jgi:hypothetical protein